MQTKANIPFNSISNIWLKAFATGLNRPIRWEKKTILVLKYKEAYDLFLLVLFILLDSELNDSNEKLERNTAHPW